MREPDRDAGPLDALRKVFLKAMQWVDWTEYDRLIAEWNDAVALCQDILMRH